MLQSKNRILFSLLLVFFINCQLIDNLFNGNSINTRFNDHKTIKNLLKSGYRLKFYKHNIYDSFNGYFLVTNSKDSIFCIKNINDYVVYKYVIKNSAIFSYKNIKIGDKKIDVFSKLKIKKCQDNLISITDNEDMYIFKMFFFKGILHKVYFETYIE